MPSPRLELTARAIILGLILSVVMGAANVYVGLTVGMTVSASIPAAVLGVLILRAIFRSGTILEANQIQTCASAGESLAAGVLFTMPALILIGHWKEFDMLTTTLVAFSGGLLGVLFMIPMRKAFVLGDNPELKYPEGVACAAVLQAGAATESNKSSALAVVKGTLLGSIFKVLASFLGVFKGTLEGATVVGNSIFYFGGNISPMLVAIGFIVRLNVAILVFLGGALAWLIGIPLLGEGDNLQNGNLVDSAYALWSSNIRYVGVGAMVIGGISSIIRVRKGLLHAVREMAGVHKNDRGGADDALSESDRLQRDLPISVILILSIITLLIILSLYYWLTKSLAISLTTTVIMIIMSFFFTAVASYIVGLVGNSNSPVSGMTITAVLFTGGLLLLFGFSGVEGMVATLGVAAVVCCAACTSGDVCNDLKTGQLVGASPKSQQIMQIAGVAVASLVMAYVLNLLNNNPEYPDGAIGTRELPAPQASLFASLVRGLFGDGELPWNFVAMGAGLGIVILIIDRILQAKGTTFRAHLMPIAVGMYLPFGLAVPMLVGGLLAHFVAQGAEGKEAERKLGPGILFSSGIIAGEALMGVGLAILASAAISNYVLIEDGTTKSMVTAVASLITLWIFYRTSKSKK